MVSTDTCSPMEKTGLKVPLAGTLSTFGGWEDGQISPQHCVPLQDLWPTLCVRGSSLSKADVWLSDQLDTRAIAIQDSSSKAPAPTKFPIKCMMCVRPTYLSARGHRAYLRVRAGSRTTIRGGCPAGHRRPPGHGLEAAPVACSRARRRTPALTR